MTPCSLYPLSAAFVGAPALSAHDGAARAASNFTGVVAEGLLRS